MKVYNTEEINQLIRNRRSIFPRQFSERIVERHVVEAMLENANCAPNHGKTEPWRFTVFSADAKVRLCERLAKIYEETTPEEQFRPQKPAKMLEKGHQASHIIAILMKRGTNPKIPKIEEIEAVACAVQNMALTASAYGAGGYWSSGALSYTDEVKELFGLGEEDMVLGFFYLGYPAEEPPSASRGDIREKTEWLEH